MKLTLSVIKADIGSIGGHICPSQKLLQAVRGTERYVVESIWSRATGDQLCRLCHA